MAVRNIERCLNSARSAVDCHHVPDFSPYFGPDIVPDQPNLWYSGMGIYKLYWKSSPPRLITMHQFKMVRIYWCSHIRPGWSWAYPPPPKCHMTLIWSFTVTKVLCYGSTIDTMFDKYPRVRDSVEALWAHLCRRDSHYYIQMWYKLYLGSHCTMNY